jgi:uncharacterized protein
MDTQHITSVTKQWIQSVVIDCNFCPFAAQTSLNNSLRMVVQERSSASEVLGTLDEEFALLDSKEEIETTLIILSNGFEDFLSYVALAAKAERRLTKHGYEGIYQIASFHPLYCFGDADDSDPANYTNRSPYPMLHLLREESITRAIEHYSNPDGIPDRNVRYARSKGLEYMHNLFIKASQQ